MRSWVTWSQEKLPIFLLFFLCSLLSDSWSVCKYKNKNKNKSIRIVCNGFCDINLCISNRLEARERNESGSEMAADFIETSRIEMSLLRVEQMNNGKKWQNLWLCHVLRCSMKNITYKSFYVQWISICHIGNLCNESLAS